MKLHVMLEAEQGINDIFLGFDCMWRQSRE